MTFYAVHLSVSIHRPVSEVYEFVSNPENIPKWISGLVMCISKVGDDWIADSIMGEVKVKVTKKNKFGILDHEVTLMSGAKLDIPMRVVPNNNGSEVSITLFQVPALTDAQFFNDEKIIDSDLQKLKELLERKCTKEKI